jgi:hypothetical protein
MMSEVKKLAIELQRKHGGINTPMILIYGSDNNMKERFFLGFDGRIYKSK